MAFMVSLSADLMRKLADHARRFGLVDRSRGPVIQFKSGVKDGRARVEYDVVGGLAIAFALSRPEEFRAYLAERLRPETDRGGAPAP